MGFLKRKVLGLAVLEWAVLLIFIAAGGIAVLYHEPWTDEAQAWLIARDLSIPGILRHVGYEGSPPLWHLLLWVLIRLHLPYSALGLVSLFIMSSAIYVWLRWAPMPSAIKLLVPFAFHYQYQYAVVARSYALSTLLAFVAAALWRSNPRRIRTLAIVLALLAQTNLYGFVIALGISVIVAVEYFRELRTQRPSREQTLCLSIAAAIVGGSLIAAKIAASPPADCYFYALNIHERLAHLNSAIPGLDAFYQAMHLSSLGAAEFLLLLMVWFAALKKRLFLLPFFLTILVMGLLWWANQHLGMVLSALLVSLWMAWPEQMQVELEGWTLAVKTALVLMLALQVPLTLTAIRNEIREPYSGAKATAEFLKPLVGKRPLYSFDSYRAALLPYFESNIFANSPETSFWVWSKYQHKPVREALLSAEFPDGAVLISRVAGKLAMDPVENMLRAKKVVKTQSFCGRLLWFDTAYSADCYDVYEKQH